MLLLGFSATQNQIFLLLRGPEFDTQLFGESGVTVEKLLGELYEKVWYS